MNNLKTIILSAIITGVITILSTLGINYLTTKKTSLKYTVQESIPFEKDSNVVRILNVDLINKGDDPVENISGIIDFRNQQINDYRVELSPGLAYEDSILNSTYKILISSLNPEEKASFSYLLNNSNSVKTDSSRMISFRAKGLFAQPATIEQSSDPRRFFYILTFATFLSMIASVLLVRKIRGGNDEQYRILAYLSGLHRLRNELERYNSNKDAEYWSEADYLGNYAFLNPTDNDNLNRLLLLKDLLKYRSSSMHDMSIAMVNYNIAKIYKVLGDDSEANIYIEKALKGSASKRISLRLEIDPVFSQASTQ